MSLSSLYLDAFLNVAKVRSFSGAAKVLSITQSALSQRVLNLEQELGATLFVREPSGIQLTDLGQKLLRYCQSKELLEDEFMSEFKTNSSKEIAGVVRLGGFSTLNKSILIPVLAEVIQENPKVQIEIINKELRDIPNLLFSGKADFIFLTTALEKQGIENHLLGYEENVLIQASSKKFREDVFLDHDPEDTTTFDFFRFQGKKLPAFKRSYLNEIYSLIEGVKLGMGRAVVPLHLVQNLKGVEIVSGYKPLKVPIYLTYYTQAFYTKLHRMCTERLQSEVPNYLRF